MPTDSTSENQLPKGLPPVHPPSARFIVQIFGVVLLIAAVPIVLFLGSVWLVRSAQTPEGFLRDLDSKNAEIRWRGAHDLAQVLKRPESLALASNPVFALDLTDRLRKAFDDLELAEEKTAGEIKRLDEEHQKRGLTMPQQEKDLLWRSLRQERNHLLYLTACLGDFTVPVGAPMLCELASKDTGPDTKSVALRKRRAVWALANLGNNYQRRYLGRDPGAEDKVLTNEQKEAVLAELHKQKDAPGRRGEWAAATLDFLNGKKTLGVDAALERCAAADDPFLRAQVALSLNFWDGDRVEPTLLRLAKDDGHGKRIEINDDD